MDLDLKRLNKDIARFRRDICLQAEKMQALIDADLDCSNAARLMMRMQTDLVLFLDKRDSLAVKEIA